MRYRIDLMPMGPHAYAAFVVDGAHTAEHRVELSSDFLRSCGLACADEEAVAHQTVSVLLERRPRAELPPVLHLSTVDDVAEGVLADLRHRLAA